MSAAALALINRNNASTSASAKRSRFTRAHPRSSTNKLQVLLYLTKTLLQFPIWSQKSPLQSLLHVSQGHAISYAYCPHVILSEAKNLSWIDRRWILPADTALRMTDQEKLIANVGAPTFRDAQLARGNPRGIPRLIRCGTTRYFFLPFPFDFACFSSTTACAAANRAIGTRNGEALT